MGLLNANNGEMQCSTLKKRCTKGVCHYNRTVSQSVFGSFELAHGEPRLFVSFHAWICTFVRTESSIQPTSAYHINTHIEILVNTHRHPVLYTYILLCIRRRIESFKKCDAGIYDIETSSVFRDSKPMKLFICPF